MNNKSLIPMPDLNLNDIVHLSKENEKLIVNFLSTSDELHTINQFYHVYIFNFCQIFYHFELGTNDNIRKQNGLNGDEFIIINSLLINLMSSSKTLVDLLINFDKKYSQKLEKMINKIYDSELSYILIMTLRNFALHGHIPLYFNQNRYSFNLDYILKEGEKFNFSKSSKEAFTKIRDEIRHMYGDIANIAFTTTLMDFHLNLLKIYYQFYIENQALLESFFKSVELKLQKEKRKIKNGQLIIEIDGELHSIIMCSKTKLFKKLMQEAKINFYDFKKQKLKSRREKN
ncbi:hypothetical protein HMPREF1048_1359 [Streptococcus mitis SK575]|uniref:Uncharacterized protein n=1 Tax=Streptococcus mitis SK575 TaxID=1095736 RepID=I0SWX8_STRMT|nr:hypothetical protein [Streptococcus mitis]EID27881.1 hypothetical protein HMPREF1048_1359 [Streptococcus mitis SK575]